MEREATISLGYLYRNLSNPDEIAAFLSILENLSMRNPTCKRIAFYTIYHSIAHSVDTDLIIDEEFLPIMRIILESSKLEFLRSRHKDFFTANNL
jgi:hypothetical protein